MSAFPEVEYDNDFKDPESSLFLETEKELIECLEEVLDELPGEICIDVSSIRLAVDYVKLYLRVLNCRNMEISWYNRTTSCILHAYRIIINFVKVKLILVLALRLCLN